MLDQEALPCQIWQAEYSDSWKHPKYLFHIPEIISCVIVLSEVLHAFSFKSLSDNKIPSECSKFPRKVEWTEKLIVALSWSYFPPKTGHSIHGTQGDGGQGKLTENNCPLMFWFASPNAEHNQEQRGWGKWTLVLIGLRVQKERNGLMQ